MFQGFHRYLSFEYLHQTLCQIHTLINLLCANIFQTILSLLYLILIETNHFLQLYYFLHTRMKQISTLSKYVLLHINSLKLLKTYDLFGKI